MRSVLLFVFCVGFLEVCYSQPSVPRRPQGFPYKAECGNVKVEIDLFLDLTCPDSKAAYPVVKQVADYYGNDVHLKTYMFPLPYHRASFLTCQGTFGIDSFNKNLTYDWINTVFDQQSSLYNSLTANLGDDKIYDILGTMAVSVGLKADDFIKRSAASGTDTRVQWKYGCTRGVYGTPAAFVNGVNLNMERAWSFEEWVKLISHLI
ncbi:uncharacterized protein [Apostichopus japonicus]|uniref:uncharacterized protein n=1 Tax=Stichopus japonicus TaxID=307972 RepID=UPI003AB8733C